MTLTDMPLAFVKVTASTVSPFASVPKISVLSPDRSKNCPLFLWHDRSDEAPDTGNGTTVGGE
jgi:hypothetical protein